MGLSIGILHGAKKVERGSFLVDFFLIEIDAPKVFITFGGNFRVSSPTLDRFGPTLIFFKASNLSFFWAGLGLSIGILHRAYIGQKRSKRGHFGRFFIIIEIDAPKVFITFGGNFRVSSLALDRFGPTLIFLKPQISHSFGLGWAFL